ncbi:MAG: hypothetical protein J5790_05285 [Bacteroidaceae bacterium]|nr:hypothetical protein [Bacteroidaceae bacterium]
MIKTGFIKSIGVPRSWTTKEGEKRETYPVTVSVPYVRNDGKQGEDIMVCDHICGNPDYVKQLQELMESQAELDLTISFSLREYNGKEFTNIKLINLSKRISS